MRSHPLLRMIFRRFSHLKQPAAGTGANAPSLDQANGGAPAHAMRGIALLLGALLCFACLDTSTKFLSAHYEVPLVMGIRYGINLALLVLLLAPSSGMQMVQTRRTGLVWVRAGCLTVASLTMGLALQRMPVAETTAIVFISPMIVVLIAGALLKERIGWLGWLAGATGFAGALLIVRPGTGLAASGIFFALCTVLVNVAYQILSRILVRTESTAALLFYATLSGTIFFGISVPWFWNGQAPSMLQAAVFVGMGVTGGLGHWLLTAAYRHATASVLAPVNYCQLLWSGLLGWLVFGDVPDHLSVLGMGIIALAGVMIAFNRRRPAS